MPPGTERIIVKVRFYSPSPGADRHSFWHLNILKFTTNKSSDWIIKALRLLINASSIYYFTKHILYLQNKMNISIFCSLIQTTWLTKTLQHSSPAESWHMLQLSLAVLVTTEIIDGNPQSQIPNPVVLRTTHGRPVRDLLALQEWAITYNEQRIGHDNWYYIIPVLGFTLFFYFSKINKYALIRM